MKGDIIFALFTAFMLIAIAVGFYMQWNPSVTAILLGMLFTEPTLKSKACFKYLYLTKIISDLCCYLEYFS